MIHFDLQPQPDTFDADVKNPGLQWLADHPDADRPRDFWSPCKPYLRNCFNRLCAYSAMEEPVGTVDHYVSCHQDKTRAYDWTNYRYAAQWINSSKQTVDGQVLDPFEVQDGWFELILPSCQLKVSPDIPPNVRERAEFTLKRLHLEHDERVVSQREEWYRMYRDGELTLAGLRKKAPLIARAVDKQHEGMLIVDDEQEEAP